MLPPCGLHFTPSWCLLHAPSPAGVSVGWGFLMAAYYLALGYYALGPDRLAARFGPHLRRMRSSASSAASSAGSAAGVAVQWVKRINWVRPGAEILLVWCVRVAVRVPARSCPPARLPACLPVNCLPIHCPPARLPACSRASLISSAARLSCLAFAAERARQAAGALGDPLVGPPRQSYSGGSQPSAIHSSCSGHEDATAQCGALCWTAFWHS